MAYVQLYTYLCTVATLQLTVLIHLFVRASCLSVCPLLYICNSAECGFLSCDCHLSLYVLILCHAMYQCITVNVFCVAQAVNTALSFFVMLSCTLYKCLYTVCDCLSAQCSCPMYRRPLRARSLTAIPGRRASAHSRLHIQYEEGQGEEGGEPRCSRA